ncbi:MAG TPA: universal stress protein [Vicinamibacterales bacterium]|nr:universal stress protein [Vicinamibacterales bacterium]
MTPYKRLLVPVDFSPVSLEALATARDLAKTTGASLHLFHSVDDVAWRYLGYPLEALGEVQTTVTDSANEQLRELAIKEQREGLTVESTLVVSTRPASAIVEFAREHAIDLIVMGTHGRGAMLRMMLGSVAEHVVRTAPCPVMVVRDPRPRATAGHARQEEASAVSAAALW